MNRKYSLKKSHDIETLVKARISVGNRFYAIYYRKIELPLQVAISISKKVGSAVIRNYEKKVTKEILRESIDALQGYRMLVIIKKTVLDLTFEEKKDKLSFLLRKMRKESNEK